MIKFKFLIHKPTDTGVSYDKWLELLKEDSTNITFNRVVPMSNFYVNDKVYRSDLKEERFVYKNARDMLFNDDFEVIYESEFTNDELREFLISEQGNFSRGLYEKINKKFLQNKWYEAKYL